MTAQPDSGFSAIWLAILRSLLPGKNSLGFSDADFLFLGVALLLAAGFLAGPKLVSWARWIAARPMLCGVVLFLTPIALRLATIPAHPLPVPRVADDFSYLLLGDTLAHFRLANPVHPMHRFFEGVFILQDPSYSSIYPLGQGIVLALGQVLFHNPWAGVAISVGLLAALCYWMLLSWVEPPWAFTGGLLAALQFGAASTWMNTYWGGAVSAIAGCLIFGSIRRGQQRPVLLGLGLSLQLLTRPFEFLLLLPRVLLFRPALRSIAIAALTLIPAAGLMLLHNHSVTGTWLTLPYQLSRYQYGIPATFTTQGNPIPHKALTVEQQVDYDAQVTVHGPGTDTPLSWVKRLFERIRFYRFFFPPALYLVFPVLVLVLWRARYWPVIAILVILWIGDAFYPYFYPHYIAAATCLFVLLAVESLRRLSEFRSGVFYVTSVLALCAGHFAYALAPAGSKDYWNGLNTADPEGRAAVYRTLEASPGQQLVFVRYSGNHTAQEWIQNAADIDRARIVWALDRGDDDNQTLRRYYPERRVWLLQPDVRPALLTPY
jgi:hypothetical protein